MTVWRHERLEYISDSCNALSVVTNQEALSLRFRSTAPVSFPLILPLMHVLVEYAMQPLQSQPEEHNCVLQ